MFMNLDSSIYKKRLEKLSLFQLSEKRYSREMTALIMLVNPGYSVNGNYYYNSSPHARSYTHTGDYAQADRHHGGGVLFTR